MYVFLLLCLFVCVLCGGGGGRRFHRSRLQLLLATARTSGAILHRCSSMSAVLGMAAVQPDDDTSDQKSESQAPTSASLGYALVRNGLGPAFDSWSLVDARSTELVDRTAQPSSGATAAGGLTAPQASLQSFLSSVVPLMSAFPLQRYMRVSIMCS